MEKGPRHLVGIIGGHAKNTSSQALDAAEALGYELARRGLAVVSGAADGIMEAACRGCRHGGGLTVGILKGNSTREANAFVDIAIPTSMDVASNSIIVWTSSVLVAFEGRFGTLNEIALALDFGKPVIVAGQQSLLQLDKLDGQLFHFPHGRTAADDAEKIADLVVQLIKERPT